MYMSSRQLDKYIEVDKKKEKKRAREFRATMKTKNKKQKTKSLYGGTRNLEAYGGTEFTEGEMNRFLRP